MPDRDPRHLPPVLPPLADLSELYGVADEPPPYPKLGLADIKSLPDLLRLWQLCDRVACRRRRCCTGDTVACYDSKFFLIPPHVLGWFAEVPQACADGEDFAAAVEDAEPFTYAAIAWCMALQAVEACEKRRRPRKPIVMAPAGGTT
jgi:hypothetical protein